MKCPHSICRVSLYSRRWAFVIALVCSAVVFLFTANGRGDAMRRVSGHTNSLSPFVVSVTRTVTKIADTADGTCDADCSLREAITAASSGDTINFSPLFNAPQTITLNGSELFVGQSITIQGPGAHLLTVSGNDASRVFNTNASPTVSLSGLTITAGNSGGLPGGGIRNGGGSLTITNCHITGNVADDGAGILSDGPLSVLSSTVSNNTAVLNGSGVGGGISAQTTLTLTNSTISANRVDVGNNNGAGVWVNGNTTITNSTITGNSAFGGNSGGGVFRNGGTTTILNSIIAGNVNNSNVADVSAAGGTGISSSGYNLIGNPGTISFSGTADQKGTSGTPLNPQLGPLALSGGPTPSHALLGGSLALDKGNATGVDQRGLPRQFNITTINQATGGNDSDVGAVEMQALIVTTETDPGDGLCDGTCSLRDAIIAANGNGPGLDDIIFSTTALNLAQAINLTTALPNITTSVTIQGPGANQLIVRRAFDATTDFRVFNIPGSGLNIAISGMTISNGNPPAGPTGPGGGVDSRGNLTLTNVAVTGNKSGSIGGGISLTGSGVFTNCTFSGNTVGDTNVGGRGGAIYFASAGGTLRLVNSTLSGNTAIRGLFSGDGLGGGVFHDNNSGNSSVELVNSTIANNTAFANGGIQARGGSGISATTLRNSIIANNTLPNFSISGTATITSLGFNLSDNWTGVTTGPTDITAQPLLAPLSLIGGQTPAHALLGGSPALDRGSRSGSTTDQRGLSRPFDISTINVATGGDNADIGAVEMQALIVTTGADPGDGVCDSTCTLRDAITSANGNGGGLDDIIFSNTVFNTAQSINLTTSLATIAGSLTINGSGANLLTVRRDNNAATNFRIFAIGGGLDVSISGMTISDGRATDNFGGGILSFGNLTLTNVHVTGNQAISNAGGVDLTTANGVFTGCTFSNNTAAGSGGGIFYQGNDGHTLRVVNSTISGNRAGSNIGGGIRSFSNGGNSRVEVVNSTITNNTATNGGGIAMRTQGGAGSTATTTLRNTIIANNTPNNLAIETAGGGTQTFITEGFNLSDNFNGVLATIATDITNLSPRLGPLSLNGGQTPTHALLSGSPALDAGHSSGATYDQRGPGFARPFDFADINNAGNGADIGAYEAQTAPATLLFSASNYNVNEGDTSVLVTVTRSGDTSGIATVDFASTNGTASQLRDYEVANGTLTFAAGQTSRTFRVLVVDDVFAEANETINLTLSNPTNATLVLPTSATVTIVDNDSSGSTSPIARQFVSNLVGAEEVPATPNTVKGNGGVFQLSNDDLSAKVSLLFSGLTGSETGAHVHAGAPGVNGPIIFPLPLGNPINNFVVNPTGQQVIDLRAGQQYMNVHSTGFLNGEIRGQLLWNPAEEADFFVRQAYFDFLSRVPDPSGFTFWTAEITNCQTDVECLRRKRVDVSNAFFYEQEFQQTAAFVLRLYRGAYGNNQPFPNPNPNAGFPNEEKKLPSYAVFVADRARVIGGANLAQKQLDLANLFVSRPEFTTKYPASLATADQFVDALLSILQSDSGVNLSSQRTNLINLYNSAGSMLGGRGVVLYRLADDNAGTNPIANQPFIDAEYNRTFVLGQYFGYLRRNPDIPGFVFWLGQVNGAPLRDVPRQHAMVCSFITSGEFQFRFGSVASRNNNECPQ